MTFINVADCHAQAGELTIRQYGYPYTCHAATSWARATEPHGTRVVRKLRMVLLDPPVPSFNPSTEFEITYGPIVLMPASGSLVNVTGTVRFVWSPTPRVAFAAASESTFMPILEQVAVTVPALEVTARGWLATQSRTSTEMRVDGYLNEAVHSGAAPGLRELRFVLVNFVETAAVTTVVRGWEVTFEPVEDLGALLRNTMAARGYLGTHVGRLRRNDRGLFPPAAAEEVRDVIYWSAAFARAQHVGVELTTGFGDSGLPVWRDWRETVIDPASLRLSWFERRYPSGLMQLLSAFATVWADLGSFISTALSFYLEASTSRSPEASIVVGSAALDLVSWLTLVERGPRLSADAFDRLWLSDRLRLILDAAGAPSEIPPELPNLSTHALREKWVDGPHTVTELRNAIVHPKKWMRAGSTPVPVHVEAKRLLLWYFDLALLKLVGYNGEYVPHLAAFPSGTVASLRPVPWSKA